MPTPARHAAAVLGYALVAFVLLALFYALKDHILLPFLAVLTALLVTGYWTWWRGLRKTHVDRRERQRRWRIRAGVDARPQEDRGGDTPRRGTR